MMVAANVIPIETEAPVNGKATLYAKLARVMGKVQKIEKNGYNSFHNYHYATATDIYEGVRAALSEENVAFLPDMVKADHDGIHTRLEFDFYFVCGDTGATKVCRWVSEADDKGDKGINKAVTFAVKYFLIATFLIATGDIAEDPDEAPPVEGKKLPAKKPTRIDTTEQPAPNGKQAWTDKEAITWVNARMAEGHSDIELRQALCIDSKWSEWDGSAADASKALDNFIKTDIEHAKAGQP